MSFDIPPPPCPDSDFTNIWVPDTWGVASLAVDQVQGFQDFNEAYIEDCVVHIKLCGLWVKVPKFVLVQMVGEEGYEVFCERLKNTKIVKA